MSLIDDTQDPYWQAEEEARAMKNRKVELPDEKAFGEPTNLGFFVPPNKKFKS